MRSVETALAGLKVIELDRHEDARGVFMERYRRDAFAEQGLGQEFIQDNLSRSHPGVLRGLHAQHTPAQGKLVGVISGSIWDVAVDIRANSPTFGQYFAIELDEHNGKLLWIPPGFAHGFYVTSPGPADVLYKVDAPYRSDGEFSIHWSDPDLAIAWPLTSEPLCSERDSNAPSFSTYQINPYY